MEYDLEGLPCSYYGKRRPNMPKTVKCFECNKDAIKVRYGTYECETCKKVYQFKYGKLKQGRIECHIKTYIDRYNCTRNDYQKVYSFDLE